MTWFLHFNQANATMTGYMMFILFRWSKSLKHVFHPPNTSSYNTKDMGIAYALFISHPENVVDGGFVSFVVQIITHISDKKSIEISISRFTHTQRWFQCGKHSIWVLIIELLWLYMILHLCIIRSSFFMNDFLTH